MYAVGRVHSLIVETGLICICTEFTVGIASVYVSIPRILPWQMDPSQLAFGFVQANMCNWFTRPNLQYRFCSWSKWERNKCGRQLFIGAMHVVRGMFATCQTRPIVNTHFVCTNSIVLGIPSQWFYRKLSNIKPCLRHLHLITISMQKYYSQGRIAQNRIPILITNKVRTKQMWNPTFHPTHVSSWRNVCNMWFVAILWITVLLVAQVKQKQMWASTFLGVHVSGGTNVCTYVCS